MADLDLAGSVAVVIDVLRATTTMTHALAAGAAAILPCLEVADAWKIAVAIGRDRSILGGERGGERIEGFDLGNSPSEYSPQIVAGKSIVFTTTNGTRAIHASRQAARILLGSFCNLTAIAREIQAAPRIDLICAGTDGYFTSEDVLLAGALASIVCRSGDRPQESHSNLVQADQPPLDDAGAIARGFFESAAPEFDLGQIGSDHGAILKTLRHSRGGRNLLALGMDHDLEVAARVDSCRIVPEFDGYSGRVAIAPATEVG